VRIETLELRAFGPFTDCSVPLCDGLNILYGPNEAGKSSALRAIRCLLYGIPAQCSDNFLHPYDKLRLAAKLVRHDGQALEFCRRKGRKGTLRDGGDAKPLDDGVLDAYLGAVDEAFFLSVFGIDHVRLRQGGEEIVRGGGKIGELLFSAGGVGDLRRRQQEIETELSDLFKPGGQKPKINSSLSELQNLRAEVKRLQASTEVWNRQEAELASTIRRREHLDEELGKQDAARIRLDRLHKALPSLAQWRSEAAELATLSDVVILRENFAEQLHDALSQRNLSVAREEDASGDLAKVTKELAAETVPQYYVAVADEIDDLFQRLGSHRKAMRDRTSVVALKQGSEHAAREVLRKMGRADSLDQIEQHRIPDDKQAQVRSLGNQYQGVLERQRAAQKLRDRLQRDLQTEESRYAECPAPVDCQDLRLTVSRVQAESHIEETILEQQRLLDQLIVEADTALQRLPLWTGALGEVEQLPVPAPETVDHFEEVLRQLTGEETALSGRAGDLTSELEQLTQKQVELNQGGELPTASELLEARAERDNGWSLVLAAWKGGPDAADHGDDFISRFPPAQDLAAAFPLASHRADSLADRLRLEADRVAASSQLETRRKSLVGRLEELDGQRQQIQDRRTECLEEWASRWRATEIIPMAPREMRGWVRQYNQLLQLLTEVRKGRTAITQLTTRRDAVRTQLVTALQSIDTAAEVADTSFLELVESSQRRLEDLQQGANRFQQIGSNIERLRQELFVAEEELSAIVTEAAAWKASWKECMQSLQLDESASPEQANSVLTNLTALFQSHQEAKGFRARIDGIDADARSFSEDTVALTSRIASDLTDCPVEEAVQQLHERMLQARDTRKRVESLTGQVAEHEQKLAAARHAISEMKAELDAMCVEAGCKEVGELAKVSEQSTRKLRLQASVAALEKQLLLLSGGQTVRDFAEEAAQVDADQLMPQIEQLGRAIEQLREDRDTLLQAAQRIKDEMSKMDGNAQAAQRANECEFLIAQLEGDVRRYVVTRIGSAALRNTIDRYRKKAEGPIVSRASELFTALTRGSFAGLRTDFDEDGQPVLLGVRPEDGGSVRVNCMSDGAGDQLFLALRIATLEHWFEHHEPVPFIVDDVLLSFDDDRALAALSALAELSRKTQIVFFTHHDHMLSMAQGALPGVLQDGEYSLCADWAHR
jgi:uncharacterized protein YhaN